MILSMVSGAGVLIAGLWMLWGKRVVPAGPGGGGADEHEAVGDGPAAGARPGRSVRERFSEPTRLVIGVSLLIAGYHLAAWGAPEAWFGVKVPRDRWWILAVGLPGAVLASVGIDRLEQRGA